MSTIAIMLLTYAFSVAISTPFAAQIITEREAPQDIPYSIRVIEQRIK